MLGFFFDVCFPWWSPNTSRHALSQALRSQTRSGSGTQKKLKIFENSCPRQLLKLACTGLHLQFNSGCMGNTLARMAWIDTVFGNRYVQIQKVCGMLGFFFDVCFPWWSPNTSRHALSQALRSQTRSGSGTQKKLKIFKNSCPRQLLKLACTGLHLQFNSGCMGNTLARMAWIDTVFGNRYVQI